MPIKAAFIDLDGTLFSPEHTITDYTAEVLRELKKAGVYFIVATGRPFPDVFARMKECDLHPDYIITSNGARIHDGNFNLVIEHNMDPQAVCTFFHISGTPDEDGVVHPDSPPKDFVMNVNREGDWLTDKCLDEVRISFHASVPYEAINPLDYGPSDLVGTHSIWCRGSFESLTRLKTFVDRNLSEHINAKFALPYILDCFPRGVDKGLAVKEVCERLQIEPESAASFGDGITDLAMLLVTGKSFIMANALPALLEQAPPHAEVIGSNAEDGVAVKLHACLSEH